MSKPRAGMPRRVGAGLVAGAVSVLGIALAPSAGAVASVTTETFAGTTRYDTAAKISADEVFATPNHVIVASGENENIVDSLAASGLAGANDNTPIVLVQRSTYTPEAKSALAALKAKNPAITVTIIGGPAAVSQTVQDAITADGFTVTRAQGADRFKTAADAATKQNAKKAVGTIGGFKTAIIANGFGNAASPNVPIDALAASPIAYRLNLPVLLVNTDSVPAETTAAITALGIQQVLIAGGPSAVSQAVETTLATQTGRAAIRQGGQDRFDTAARLGTYAVTTLGFPATSAILANGITGVDALAAGPLGGELGAPIGLSASLPEFTRSFFDFLSALVTKLYVAGGPLAVDNATVQAAIAALQTVNNDSKITGQLQPTVKLASGAPGSATENQGRHTMTLTFDPSVTGAVDVAVLPIGSLVIGPTGAITFTDADANAQADSLGVCGLAQIELIDGVVPAGGAAGYVNDQAVPSDRTLEVTLDSTQPNDVCVVIAFTDTGNDNQVTLSATRTSNETFGVAGPVLWTAAEASFGADTVMVGVPLITNDVFTSFGPAEPASATDANPVTPNGTRFEWDSGDTFRVGGVTVTQANFEQLVSFGDIVQVSYDPTSTGTSIFDLLIDVGYQAPGVTVTVANLDGGSTSNDVTARITAPALNKADAVYLVQSGSTAGPDGICGTGDDLAANQVTFATVGQTTATPGGQAVTVPLLNVANGCYLFRVRVTNPVTGANADTGNTPVNVPGAPDTQGPVLVQGSIDDNGFPDVFDVADRWFLLLQEQPFGPGGGSPVQIGAGDIVRVEDFDGEFMNVVLGTGNTFTVVQRPASVGEQLLSITFSQLPAIAGDSDGDTTNNDGQLEYNGFGLIITNQNGFTDPAGNPWLPGPDVLFVDGGPPGVFADSADPGDTQFTVTFFEAIDVASAADPSNYQISNVDDCAAPLTGVNPVTNAVVSQIPGQGFFTVTLSVQQPLSGTACLNTTVRDVAGNPSTQVAYDLTNPVVVAGPQFVVLGTPEVGDTQVTFMANMPINPATLDTNPAGGFDDFTETGDTEAITSVSLQADNQTVIVTLDGGLEDGESVTLTAGSVSDPGGNAGPAGPVTATWDDQTAPVIVGAVADEGDETVILTYSENVTCADIDNVAPRNEDYSVTINGTGRAITNAACANNVVTLTIQGDIVAADDVDVASNATQVRDTDDTPNFAPAQTFNDIAVQA